MERERVYDGNMENLYNNRTTKRQKSGVRFSNYTRQLEIALSFLFKTFVKIT